MEPDDLVVAGAIPQEPPGFLPRAALLARLDLAAPGIAVLTGEPGTGKTQLAGAYARARLADGWRLVAWVNARDTDSLLAGLATVAEAAGLSDGELPGGGAAASAGVLVRHLLEADGDRCLLVFDNVGDPGVLRPFVPPAGTAAQILIVGGQEGGCPVEAFTMEEAVSFLAARTGRTRADAAAGAEAAAAAARAATGAATEAAALAAELGCLPLALALAAGLMAAKHLAYQTYLERLRSLSAAQYLGEDQAQGYPNGLAEAILLSAEAIRADDPAGVFTGVIEIVAVLSPAGVRRELLHAAGQAGAFAGGRQRLDAIGMDQVLALLGERSLLTFSLDGQVILAHPLVMRVMRDRLARRGRLPAACRAAARALDAHAAAVVGSADREAARDVPEQAAALLHNAAGQADAELAELLLRIQFWALHCLNQLGGSARRAIAVGEPLVAEAQRLLGSDDPDTLNAQNSLAIAYHDAGRVAEAIALHEQTLGAFERARGPNHPSALASRNNLAEAYRAAGRAAEAAALHEQAAAGYERIRGPDHPDTLTSRSHLAEAYRAAGRAAEAAELHERVLAARERIRGPDDPDTLTSRSQLARAYQAAGRTAEAVALLEQVLAVRERVRGPDHPGTLGARSNLANAYRAAGRIGEAVALLEQTVAGYERIRGPDHPSTLGAQNNLGNAYRAAGRAAEAVALHERVLAARDRVLGPDHPDTGQSRHNLARARRDAYGGTDDR